MSSQLRTMPFSTCVVLCAMFNDSHERSGAKMVRQQNKTGQEQSTTTTGFTWQLRTDQQMTFNAYRVLDIEGLSHSSGFVTTHDVLQLDRVRDRLRTTQNRTKKKINVASA